MGTRIRCRATAKSTAPTVEQSHPGIRLHGADAGAPQLGIFGVVSYGVALRTKEIGIRVGLGARHPALLQTIVRQVLSPVAIGVLIALILALRSASP